MTNAIKKLNNNNIHFVFITSGLKRFLQLLDISINYPFKDKLRNCHALWSQIILIIII